MTLTARPLQRTVSLRLTWRDRRGMDTFISSASAGSVVVSAVPLRLAVSAYLSRFKGHLQGAHAQVAGVRLPRMHPHVLRHTFVTTMLDAGVDLRDVQIAARHADPRTTMRYDRPRKNVDRHPNYILAADVTCGT